MFGSLFVCYQCKKDREAHRICLHQKNESRIPSGRLTVGYRARQNNGYTLASHTLYRAKLSPLSSLPAVTGIYPFATCMPVQPQKSSCCCSLCSVSQGDLAGGTLVAVAVVAAAAAGDSRRALGYPLSCRTRR